VGLRREDFHSVDLTLPIRGLSVSVAGTVKITKRDGTTDTLTVPVGIQPMFAQRLWATGTTATGFVGYPAKGYPGS
jgi:hypothetical protein